MNDKSFNIRVPKRWVRVAMIVGVTALIVAPLTAIASHSFTDVPDSNTFHSDIEWMKDAGVTAGCNPPENTEYCPDDDVTRGQMAAFMNRFAGYIGATDGTPAQADSANTADNATNLGGESPDEVKSIAFGDTCGTDCPNDDDQMAQAAVEIPASGVVELNYSLSVLNDSGGETLAVAWASQGACETDIVFLFPVPGNAIPGSLAQSHVQDGDQVNVSSSTTVSVDAGNTSFSSCLIMLGTHDVVQGTVTGSWNPGNGGVGIASASEVVTFSEEEIAQFEESYGDSLDE